MRRITTTATMAAAAFAMAASIACSDRAERDAEAAARETERAAERTGAAASETARDAGNAVSDAARATGDAVMNGGKAADAAVETLDVKAALTADSRVDASHINVDSDHVTKTVTLKGRVPTQAQKNIAEEIAIAEATGYRVRNELSVGN